VALHCNLGNAVHRVSIADPQSCGIVLSSNDGAVFEDDKLLVPPNAAVVVVSPA